MNLTIGDGFKFGCGAILALAFAAAILLLLVAIAAFVSALFGFHLPFAPS